MLVRRVGQTSTLNRRRKQLSRWFLRVRSIPASMRESEVRFWLHCRLRCSQRDHRGSRCGLGAELRPCRHQSAALLEQVATQISLLGLVVEDMGERRLDELAREIGALACPGLKSGPESVDGAVAPLDLLGQCAFAEAAAWLVAENELAAGGLHSVQDGHGCTRKGDPMLTPSLHPLRWHDPHARPAIDLRPADAGDFAAPGRTKDQKFECRCSNSAA